MFIQTEVTPNPASLKYLPGRMVMTSGTAHFITAAEAQVSPLARAIFALDGVDGVFLGADFITVTKKESEDWSHLSPFVLGTIMDHFMKGFPVIDEVGAGSPNEPVTMAENYDPMDEKIVTQIKELIETRVRPAVAQDGGDIVFHGFQKGVVTLHMQGSCAGCPSSTATLKMGIENMLKHYVPEVVSVVSL